MGKKYRTQSSAVNKTPTAGPLKARCHSGCAIVGLLYQKSVVVHKELVRQHSQCLPANDCVSKHNAELAFPQVHDMCSMVNHYEHCQINVCSES